jgi:hypothetical protein
LVVRRIASGAAHANWPAFVAALSTTGFEQTGAPGGASAGHSHARVLKADGPRNARTLVLACDGPGTPLIVKREPVVGPLARLRSALGHTRLDRHWRGAEALDRAGVPTARCLALLTQRARRGLDRQAPATWLVMERLDGPTLLELIARAQAPHAARPAGPAHPTLSPCEQHAVARAVGLRLARLVACGLANRDAKPSNWIVTRNAGGELVPAVIDCVGLRRATPARVARMLAALVIEPIGVGVPIRRTLMLRTLTAFLDPAGASDQSPAVPAGRGGSPRRPTRPQPCELWHRVARVVESHLARPGGARPSINPLASTP